jgi:MYXO-CTERM domain-containing protein
MRTARYLALAWAALALPGLSNATATFGSLANFDVVNDTGSTARGFEIELEGLHQSDIIDVFGLNRDFGTASPGDVERYGLPTVSDLLDATGTAIGVKIRYAAQFDASSGAWSTGTASGAFATPGESCWQFGNVNYPNVPCDHFGVSTYGNPTRTSYQWLVESGTPGQLTPTSVAVPAVTFTPPTPVVQGQPPAPVVAVIQAQQVDLDPRKNAFWVKIVQTSLPEAVDLNDLLGGQFQGAVPQIAALNDKVEQEIEWQVLQPGFVDEVSKSLPMQGDPSVVVRFEFYKYLGRFDDEGLVDPLKSQAPHGDTLNEFVGAYVGQQIAGFNLDQAAAVPEPEGWALGLAGLGTLLTMRRKRTA